MRLCSRKRWLAWEWIEQIVIQITFLRDPWRFPTP
jgi:hypothetical protein